MAYQQYVKSDDTHIMCIVRKVNNENEVKGIVVLIPGFSQSCCDIDYFMTNLANELNYNGYITVQVDLYGHGDSYGDLASLSIQIIENNILSVCEYLRKIKKDIPVFAISRGIFGNVICKDRIASNFTKIISINAIANKHTEDLGKINTYKGTETIEIEELLARDEFFQMFFVALGADNTNIKGQKINELLLCEIITEINNLEYPENATLISSYNDTNEISVAFSLEEFDFTIDYISNHCFVRDPDWQKKLIDKVVELVEENRNENTISNK